MRSVWAAGLAWVFSALLAGHVAAQGAIPDHRYLQSRDMDFYGEDLTNLFDTTQAACARACSAQEACVAYTFNTRNNACFPKSAIRKRQPYAGAVSAQKVATDPQVLARGAERQKELVFLTEDDFNAARARVASNAASYSFSGETLDELTAALRGAEQAGEGAVAYRWASKAAALSDRAEMWTAYARKALAHAGSGTNAERRKLRQAALQAAINGFLRAEQPALRVESLRVMAQALEAGNRGRDMIPALRLALDITPRDDLKVALTEAIGKYGFRVTDHRVDNNAAAPRICAEFSERLVPAGVDYEPFVRVEGRGLVVQAEDNQLCIDGVEHGARYTVTLRVGLPAASGEVLHRDTTLQLYVRDRAAAVRFAGRAYVLPRSADAALPVETVNATTLDLSLRRVSDRNLVRAIRESYFGRPLGADEDDRFSTDLAQEVWTGTAEVQNELNVDMTTRLPLAEALVGQPAGIYTLSAAVPGQDRYENPAAMQWFVLSDLGVTTWQGTDGMQVALRRLSDASAGAGIRVSLISRANAVLGEAVTDADGFAQFPAGLSRGTGAARPALLMAEEGATDVAFLPLTDPAFDLSDRGVEGHPPAPPIDTFLTTDRGAYRVGETIYVTALTRDGQARALQGLPVTALLKRPDGVEYSRQSSTNSKAGGHVFALPLEAQVPRGAWRVDILSDLDGPPLASQTVLVEDFLPERIDFDVTLPDAPLRVAQTLPLGVDVRYLFGAAGAHLEVEGDVRLTPTRRVAGWEGYMFGRYDSAFRTRTRAIDRTMTDAAGDATLSLQLPKLDETPQIPLSAAVTLRVAEGSGRPVERRVNIPVTPAGVMIGIKPAFEDVLPEGGQAAFDLIAVNPDGSAAQVPVRWTVNKVETRYQWYQLYGNWEWEPVTRRIRVATGEVPLGDAPARVTVPTEWGGYELLVERTGGPYAAASVEFASGWYGSNGASDTPDRLTLSLDAETYDTGDTASLRLVAEGDGVAMISVLSNRVIERRVVPVVAGENTVRLTVGADWGTGAYVTASVLRGMDVAAGVNPSRQLGLVHAAVAPADKKLNVSFEAPAQVDGQAGTMTASVLVDGVAEGQTAFVTLAAVDLGIVNLTGFTAPDPTDHYFGQRRLGVELRDIYGRLIDGMNGALGTVRSGGDAAASVQVQSPPPTEKLMAFFSGPVVVGPDGRATVEIIKPAFNGTIRLMAVAWSDDGVGDATFDVIAKDPVVVTASLPRFLAPGDTSRLLLELVHASGTAGDAALQIHADSGVALGAVPATIRLEENATARLEVPVSAREIGDNLITVVLTTPEGRELRKVLNMPVRDNDPEVALTRQFALAAGQSFTFDSNVFAGLRDGTGMATLTAGPLARFDVPGLLQQLDRYPYGCTEQLTSGAMPLLYLSSVAQAAGLGKPAQINDRITQAIARILTRQSSNGAFGVWRAHSGEFWLDAYVTDFLFRARAEGYAVPDTAYSLAMDNLRNRISYAPDFDQGGEDIAYALLVLARAGAAHMGDLRYYADTKAEDFATPLALAQLGAALAAYGDPLRADAMFRKAGVMLNRQTPSKRWRDDFGTPLRDTAAVLKLSAEAGSAAVDPVTLTAGLQAGNARLSTQEAAQVVLAAHALSAPEAAAKLRVDGVDARGPVVQRLSARTGGTSVIENISDNAIDVTMTAYGVPEVAPEAGGYGYQITRRIFTMEGVSADGPVASGTRLVVVLKVTPFEEVGARLIIDDPLPAGFEIDNPNLLRSGDIAALDWLETKDVENAEFRSDRFVAAVNHRQAKPFELAYVVRAVTPGIYHHPAATVEDMYRAEYRANTATGSMTVTP
ncbi:alpha-2-macroglobulin family protein [Sulfitobacter sp. M57]|uniref:alpha-2-macroglobulin family protein n=1 Tax=unclassified Sulfitobacter TaxID=196795 RepID=UPI0023E19AC9|nr:MULTISPECIES: alpha-2-macroglobulin family protein [unclassified Sulfitobacter]MDF3415257.1 alpha-2-macroglobulin family protein [Sulfitobacter sp. KE5]MDF3422738.1 alpha-2-macroglobulin family protein [Sulfitobacter sp. KE43]MDF3433803.1 alpha-2-macroglobulin family protein [Sulfitobacter sp. KE42]MDF3459443.1 alpha-2-macroglobulin family protein [Sulfitobacter sp. S74]MDF3463342.1 alpha-2-macroglobulin family protein [Sulfitobacter sp. Ks18]